MLLLLVFTAVSGKRKESVLMPGEDAAISPDGTSIAFRQWVGGNSEIFIAPLDGSAAPRRLTDDPGSDQAPAWSPDGKRICFVSNRSGNKDLWVVEIDHPEQPVQITTSRYPEEDPSWSPDGRLIAYVGVEGGNADLFTIPAVGGEPIRLTNDPDDASGPTWSRDGRRLAYASDRGGARNIWMMDFGEGSDRPRASVDRTSKGTIYRLYQLTTGDWDDSEPAWCPTADIVAFSSNRRSDTLDDWDAEKRKESGARQIFWVSTGPRPVLTVAQGSVNVLEGPTWAPNGLDLVYTFSLRPAVEKDRPPPELRLLRGARSGRKKE